MPETAIVVGGGPAGLSAAIGLARAGFCVKLFERRRKWQPRVCGAFLSPEAAGRLEELGVLEEARRQAAVCESVELHAPSGRNWNLSLGGRGFPGLALSRRDLEGLLRRRAESEGVAIESGAECRPAGKGEDGRWRVRILRAEGDREEEASVLVAADGRFSAFRRAPVSRATRGWLGWNTVYEGLGTRAGYLALFFAPGVYAGVLTFADGTSNLSGLIRLSGAEGPWERQLERLTARSPGLQILLKRGKRVAPFSGIPALPFGTYAPASPGLFLAGDSAAVGDPFLGEGLGRSLASGPLLQRAFSGRPRTAEGRTAAWKAYEALWMDLYARRFRFGGLLRRALTSRWTLSMALGAVGRWPALSDRVLDAAHLCETAAGRDPSAV